MTLRRYTIDLAIPEDNGGNLPAALQAKPTAAQLSAMADMSWLQIIVTMVRRLKTYAVDINPTRPMAELVQAKVHRCHHDEIPPRPCEREEDL